MSGWGRRAGRSAAFAAVLLAACLLPAPAVASESLQMTNLRIDGGEASWHADNVFRLEWDGGEGLSAQAKAFVYRLYDQNGTLVAGPARKPQVGQEVTVEVPAVSRVYVLEAWLESSDGQTGSAVMPALRFDNAAPPAPAPQAPPGWLASRQPAALKIGHPQTPLPLAGIRGYAISLDSGGGSSPCAGRRCTLAETDLPGGISDDTIALGALPEGVTQARVVAVSGSGIPSPVATATFRVDTTPPRVSLQGLPPNGWSNRPLWVTAVADDALSGMAPGGTGGPFTALAIDGALPQVAAGDSASALVAGSGLHQVRYFARDAAGNVDDGELGAPAPALAAVGIDEEPPRVVFAARQDPEEPERIEATVSDSLSGPSPEQGWIGLRRLGEAAGFRQLPTQVSGDRLIAHWNSDAYPAGRYEFLAHGFDRAGNAASGARRSSGPKMILANPLKTPAMLEAGFKEKPARRSGARSVRFGQGVRFGGRLTSGAGSPLGGLEVVVAETFAAGAQPGQRITFVRTDGDGTFSLRLGPGPSREVTAVFAGTRTLTRASAPGAHLGVRAWVRLRASAATARIGGPAVVFSGRVGRAGAASSSGLPVELQFRYPGAGWSEFRSVETDSRGRFRYAYRFSDDDSRGVRFQFRARLGKKEGWPYEPAFSHPVLVTGR